MSGIGEIVGIIACVAAVISAYKDASVIVHKIKQKRAAKRAPPLSRLLEDSINQAPDEIEREKQIGLSRFGKRFDQGDEIAIIALQGVTIELQRRLLEKLSDAVLDDEVQDFRWLVDVTDRQRDKTKRAMMDLKERLLQAESIVQVSNITPAWSSEPSPSEADAVPQSEKQRSAVRPSWRITFSGIFKLGRTKSSAQGDGMPPSSVSQESPPRVSVPKDTSKSSFPPASPIAPYVYEPGEDDPQIIWGRSSTSSERSPSLTVAPNMPISMNNTLFRTGSEARRRLAEVTPTSENHYLGFCKSAWKLQNGDRKAMQKCKEFNDGWSSSKVYYLRCTSKKCAFAGSYAVDEIWDKVWSPEGHGIKFRWTFLAKSHVAQDNVKDHKYFYQCLFCVFLGQEARVIHGPDLYMEHIRQDHCGRQMSEVVLFRSKCIAGRVAEDKEDFDINLAPAGEVQLAALNQFRVAPESELRMRTSSKRNDSMFQESSSDL